MIFIRTGILSDRDILKLMGKDIFIYPFNKKNLKASSYNLTASILAYRIEEKTTEDKDKNDHKVKVKKLLVDENKNIIIEKNTTALIQTNESIYVSNKICGTYHSKVSLCNKGLSHIGTTLDPCYFGTSLIAIHNHSQEVVKIKVGDTFASLIFNTLRTKSKCFHNNLPFRTDLQDLAIEEFDKIYLNKNECKGIKCDKYSTCQGEDQCGNKIENKYIDIKNDIIGEIEEWRKEEWRSNLEELKIIVKNDKSKRNEGRNIKIVEQIFGVLQVIAIVFFMVYIWVANFDSNSTGYRFIITLIGVIPVVLKIIETIIKNFIRGE